MSWLRACGVLLAVLGGGMWAEQGSMDAPFAVRVGEVLEFSLDGELWTYEGYANRAGERVEVRLERKIEATSTGFRGVFSEAGTYALEFFRQDARSGKLEKRFLVVEVSEAEEPKKTVQAGVEDAPPSPDARETEPEPQGVGSDVNVEARRDLDTGKDERASLDEVLAPTEDLLAELLRLSKEGKDVTSRMLTVWPDATHVELVEQALQRLSTAEMPLPAARYRSFPELMYRLAWMLERAPTARDLMLAHRLYHRLAQYYPADPLVADALHNDRKLERDFIWVY